jgi:DNA (cytosine-5)-methyltransferase 1
VFWVADSDGRDEGHGRLQRGGEHGQRAPDGGVVRVADTRHERMRGAAGPCEATGGRTLSTGSGCGFAGGVAHAEHAERGPLKSEHERNRDAEREETAGRLGACCAADGMGHTASRGCGERRDAAQPGRGGHVDRAGWARCDILPCRDGKARRVEAGTFPLADGIPGRMGLLRGYGNAIVPEVAEVFVRAWMDCRANNMLTVSGGRKGTNG